MDKGLKFETELLAPGKVGNSYVAYPSWKNWRWILPTDPVLRKKGMMFFRPYGVKGKLAKQLITKGLLPGRKVGAADALLGALGARIATEMGMQDVALALAKGAEGAYQGFICRMMAHDGQVLAYAKLADADLAIAKLEKERRILKMVGAHANLQHSVPQIIKFFRWRGMSILLATSGPEAQSARTLTPAHVDFLKTLFDATTRRDAVFVGKMWQGAEQKYAFLRLEKTTKWAQRIGRGMDILKQRWDGRKLPLCLAHGDFAPWNISVDSKGLFVFDWENAVLDAPPLYDAFHFMAIQNALKGKPFWPTQDTFQPILAKLSPRIEAGIDELFLAYLLYCSLFYLEARKKSKAHDSKDVVAWLGHHIDEWMEKNDA